MSVARNVTLVETHFRAGSPWVEGRRLPGSVKTFAAVVVSSMRGKLFGAVAVGCVRASKSAIFPGSSAGVIAVLRILSGNYAGKAVFPR